MVFEAGAEVVPIGFTEVSAYGWGKVGEGDVERRLYWEVVCVRRHVLRHGSARAEDFGDSS